MESRPWDVDRTMSTEDYVLSLERRLRNQREQICRLRRRGRVLMNLLLEMGVARKQFGSEDGGKVLSFFREDPTSERS